MPSDIESLLPLRPASFAVLLALVDGPHAGFEIMERANASLPGQPILGPGTLYRILRELRGSDWVVRVDTPPGEHAGRDERRSYHALTSLGRRVMRAEAERLARAMGDAGVLGDKDGGA